MDNTILKDIEREELLRQLEAEEKLRGEDATSGKYDALKNFVERFGRGVHLTGGALLEGGLQMAEFPQVVGDWLGRKLTGETYEEQQAREKKYKEEMKSAPWWQRGANYDVRDLREAVKPLLFKPQNLAEEIEHTAISFLPGALVGGPQGIGAKAAGALAGGAGSEIAGYFTDDNPYARLAAALLGGVTGGGLYSYLTREIPRGLTRASATTLRNATTQRSAPNVQRLGPEAMVLDANQQMTGLATGVASEISPYSDDIINTLAARDRGRAQRLLDATDDALGLTYRSPRTYEDVLNKVAQRRTGPMYTNIKQNAPALPPNIPAVTNAQVQHVAEGMIPVQRRGAEGLLTVLNDALNAGDPNLVSQRLHHFRMAIDDMEGSLKRGLVKIEDAPMLPVLRAFRDTIDDVMKNRLGYDTPDAIFAHLMQRIDDMKFGYDVLDKGKFPLSPSDLSREMRSTRQPWMRNIEAVRRGAHAKIRDVMGTSTNDYTSLRGIVGGDNAYNQSKISRLFGRNAQERLSDAVEAEGEMSRNSAYIWQGSQTARRTAARKAAEPPFTFAVTPETRLGGLATKGVLKLANALSARLFSRMSENYQRSLVWGLTRQGPEAVQLLNDLSRVDPSGAARLAQLIVMGGQIAGRSAVEPVPQIPQFNE